MKKILTFLFVGSAFLSLTLPMLAQEPVDLVTVTKIREQAQSSQVMDILWSLTDGNGPRLTGSPGLKRAMDWSRSTLEDWGMVNAHLEPWGEFGKGWELKKFSLAMTSPYYTPLIGFPKAWTGGTNGKITGKAILVTLDTPEDLEKFKGKLNGAIVVMTMDREAETHFEADAHRYTDSELSDMAQAPDGGRRRFPGNRAGDFRRRRQFRNQVTQFLIDEKVGVVLEGSRGDDGTVFVSSGGSREKDDPPGVPAVVLAAEHQLRLIRMLEKNMPVELEVEVETQFYDDDLQGYNVVADFPGTDPQLKSELVMLGGHLDSWHAGTGATDNAAGCSVAMEAIRLLKAVGVQPRRTIRIALWSGEEEGLLGSAGYVREHFADRQSMDLQPSHSKFAGYFNLDNGTGRVRGIYLQGNAAVRPIFEAYLKPFNDMGASTITIRNTGGTDHLSFDRVGLPGFQFIQDPIDYGTRTHHTNMDVYDNGIESDLVQASVIMASFVYHTAMRDEKLPRKALPQPQPPRRPQAVESGGQ